MNTRMARNLIEEYITALGGDIGKAASEIQKVAKYFFQGGDNNAYVALVEELAWFLHKAGVQIAGMPVKPFIPRCVAQTIARLRDPQLADRHFIFAQAVIALEHLGYAVESHGAAKHRRSSGLDNYRQFSQEELNALAEEVSAKVNEYWENAPFWKTVLNLTNEERCIS